MSDAEDFMIEARQAVAARRNGLTHKITTMAWYSGRKTIQGAPAKVLTSAGALIPIPVVGGVLNAAVDKAIEKFKATRKNKKRVAYQAAVAGGASDIESLRKQAKADAKDQKTLAEKIDSNLLKLKDARIVARDANEALVGQARQSIPRKDACWAFACALYEVQHYEDKLQLLVETMRERLDTVSGYLDESRTRTEELEEDCTVLLAELVGQGLDIVSQQHSPLRPANYSRMT